MKTFHAYMHVVIMWLLVFHNDFPCMHTYDDYVTNGVRDNPETSHTQLAILRATMNKLNVEIASKMWARIDQDVAEREAETEDGEVID